ncbi:MAG: hypothetical protein DLM72_10200 [Candidatus Nitrosopolaris wilkensis]|nr:MAG: hypothetical protein DLM72_10200 [Candidatus Nitrosopolaris wilkensis]
MFFFLGALSVQVAEIIIKLLVFSDSRRKTDVGTLILSWTKFLRAIFSSWTKFLRAIFSVNRYGYVWIIIAAAKLAFLYTPSVFDFERLHEHAHIAQHISFVVVSAVNFLAVRSLGVTQAICTICPKWNNGTCRIDV